MFVCGCYRGWFYDCPKQWYYYSTVSCQCTIFSSLNSRILMKPSCHSGCICHFFNSIQMWTESLLSIFNFLPIKTNTLRASNQSRLFPFLLPIKREWSIIFWVALMSSIFIKGIWSQIAANEFSSVVKAWQWPVLGWIVATIHLHAIHFTEILTKNTKQSNNDWWFPLNLNRFMCNHSCISPLLLRFSDLSTNKKDHKSGTLTEFTTVVHQEVWSQHPQKK